MTGEHRAPVLPELVFQEAWADLVAQTQHEGVEQTILEHGIDPVMLTLHARGEVRLGENPQRPEQEFNELASAYTRGVMLGLKLASRMGQRR